MRFSAIPKVVNWSLRILTSPFAEASLLKYQTEIPPVKLSANISHYFALMEQ